MHLLRNNKISNAQSISPTNIQIPRTPRIVCGVAYWNENENADAEPSSEETQNYNKSENA